MYSTFAGFLCEKLQHVVATLLGSDVAVERRNFGRSNSLSEGQHRSKSRQGQTAMNSSDHHRRHHHPPPLIIAIKIQTHTRLLQNGSTNMLDLKQKHNTQSISQ